MTKESEELLKLFGRLMQQRMFTGAAMQATRFGEGQDYGNSRGQVRLLQLLAEKDDISNATIAEKLDIRPSSVSILVKKLEEAGFIERRSSESDKRVQLIHLTQSGRDYIKSSHALRDDMSTALFAGLSAAEQKQLHSLISKLLTSLEANQEGQAVNAEFARLMREAQAMQKQFGASTMPPFGRGRQGFGPQGATQPPYPQPGAGFNGQRF